MTVVGNRAACQRAGSLERRAVRVGHSVNHLQHWEDDRGLSQEALLSRRATCNFPQRIL
jgi:hypothetical protein